MNLKFTTLCILATGLALSACSTKDSGDTGSTGGDAGTTTGTTGTTTTGTTTTGTTTTGTTSDTGIFLMYWNGSAAVTPNNSYEGYEDLYTEIYPSGDDLCTIEYSVSGTPDNTCNNCDWAFNLTGAGDGVDDGAIGCPWLISAFGGSSAADIGAGSQFSYGYSSDYYGYETMFYYYQKYGWYGVYYASATYDGSTFDYSWYSGGYYFYWSDL